MTTVGGSIAGDAVIVLTRSGHSRHWDHNGTQPDTVVVIDGPIGRFPTGTNVHDVLADMISRLTELESGSRSVWMFPAAAFIQPWFSATAVISRSDMAHSLTADAWKASGGSFTLDAAIGGTSKSFSVRAFFIDNLG